MPNWSGGILTTKGQALQAKVDAGQTLLILTKMKIGSGVIPAGQTLQGLNDLVAPEMNVPISAVSAEGNVSTITGVITNAGLTNGFNVRELGVFAQDPTLGEILYSITIDSAPDYLPPEGGSVTVSSEFCYNIVASNSSNVTATLNSSGLMTVSMLQQHKHDGSAGNGPKLTANNIVNDLISGLGTTDVQSTLAAIYSETTKKGTNSLRNVVITGPIDNNGNAAALYSDLTTSPIKVKAGTIINFANGYSGAYPVDIPYNVLADIPLTLPAADANTIPLQYTADLCNGGTAISGGDSGAAVKEKAFDNDTTATNYWTSSQVYTAVSGAAAIGYNFGSPKAIRRIKYTGYSTTAGNVSSVKAQFSSNGTTWNDANTVSVDTAGGAVNYINIPAVGPYQYWRLLANSNLPAASAWSVVEIEMYEALQTHYIYTTRDANGNVTAGSTRNKTRTAKPVTAATTMPGYYTDDVCNGGTPLSGGDYSTFTKDKAFNNSIATQADWWASSLQGSAVLGTSYIGYHFTANKTIRKIKLDNGDGGNASTAVSSVKIQTSTDGVSWTDVQTNSVVYGANEITISGLVSSAYWRLLANSTLASTINWWVKEIEMMEYVDPSTSGIQSDDTTYSDNRCIGGAAISGGDYGLAKEVAFDGIIAIESQWQSLQNAANQNGVSYIGYDFGVARHIRKLIVAGSGNANNTVSTAKVQRSTDGSTWNDVLTVALTPNTNTIYLPASTASRYWRILAAANLTSTYTWILWDISMYEVSTEVNMYDPIAGVSKHYDGSTWDTVVRKFLGEAVVDSAGKIVSYTTYDYNKTKLKALPGEDSDDVVTMGQFKGLIGASGWMPMPNGMVFQWAKVTPAAASEAVVFPVAFDHACVGVFPSSDGLATGYLEFVQYTVPTRFGFTWNGAYTSGSAQAGIAVSGFYFAIGY